MSMSDLFPSGPAALPLRELILSALAEAAINRQGEIAFCADCRKAIDGLCPDHRLDSALADDYEAAYARVAAGSSEWADLAVTLTGAMN